MKSKKPTINKGVRFEHLFWTNRTKKKPLHGIVTCVRDDVVFWRRLDDQNAKTPVESFHMDDLTDHVKRIIL